MIWGKIYKRQHREGLLKKKKENKLLWVCYGTVGVSKVYDIVKGSSPGKRRGEEVEKNNTSLPHEE